MGKVCTGFTMSLDGFIAGPDDSVEHLFDWYDAGDTELVYPGGMVVKVSPESAQVIQEQLDTIGVIVTGRRLFDLTNGWGGRHPIDKPVVVVTHNVPQPWLDEHEGAPFTFVTDGIESVIRQAQEIAGDKTVAVAGANVAQQCIQAGLIDEVGIDLVPFLLGNGISFFDRLGIRPLELELTKLVQAPGVTHMFYRVVK